jgi:hypothetical protein
VARVGEGEIFIQCIVEENSQKDATWKTQY